MNTLDCFIHRAIFVWPRSENAQKHNKHTKIERFDWLIERIQTRVAFGWLSERSGEKTSCPRTVAPENFLEIHRYFAFDFILQHDGQSDNSSPYKEFLKPFHPLADKTNNEHLPKPFFKVIQKSLYCHFFFVYPLQKYHVMLNPSFLEHVQRWRVCDEICAGDKPVSS